MSNSCIRIVDGTEVDGLEHQGKNHKLITRTLASPTAKKYNPKWSHGSPRYRNAKILKWLIWNLSWRQRWSLWKSIMRS